MNESLGIWIVFHLFVLAMLALDLGVLHRQRREVSFGEALAWSLVWIGLALLFNLGILATRGPGPALEFLTGYLIEKSLSVDNLFVFLLVFAFFRVPPENQHRILFWGILGALTFRALFIACGIALIERFHWMIYVFGAALIVSGIKMALQKDAEGRPERNPLIRLVRRLVPVSDDDGGGRFLVRRDGRWLATPLLLALIVVELSDVVFAVDSIPAILAITRDPFLVYTSNVFAILGLRSLYFTLAGFARRFHLLHYGLAAVLVFVGTKMMLADLVKIPTGVSLGVVAVIVTASVVLSIVRPERIADGVLSSTGLTAEGPGPARSEA
jgi:tellurite resistance protein TerC